MINMSFYERYTSWGEAVNKAIDTLHLMDIEADWKHILGKEQDLEKWLIEIDKYNLWTEFEGFALATEQKKVDAFFLVVEGRIISWLEIWERTYGFEDWEKFKEWFYKLAFSKLKKGPEETYRIYKLINRTDNNLRSIYSQFEQIKNTYTNLPPRVEKLFYERVRVKFLKPIINIENPINRYTYLDWMSDNMDEILVRFYLSGGEDIQPLIWPEKWQQFNESLEGEYNRLQSHFSENDPLGFEDPLSYSRLTVNDLTDLFINRIVHHEGDKYLLFRHQIEFYPVEERKKIWAEMAKTHTQIVADNWYHLQKWIDTAIKGSVDAPKFIVDTVNVIECYFAGQAVDLIYPLYKPYKVSQQAIIDAYQSLLRGYTEVEYIRPSRNLKEVEGIITKEDIKNYKPQHLTGSPFVEAELLVKAKDYLIQRLAELKPVKGSKVPSAFNLLCSFTEIQIKTLFTHLTSGGYIDSAVTLAKFSDMLLGVEPANKPLQWLKSNRALAYLFRQMHTNKFINNDTWQSIIQKRNLFSNRKNKTLTSQDLAQAITDYQAKGNPTEASNIDVILEEVKALRD